MNWKWIHKMFQSLSAHKYTWSSIWLYCVWEQNSWNPILFPSQNLQYLSLSSSDSDQGIGGCSSCYNCDQWRVRKMRGGWTGRRERRRRRGRLWRTVRSCHAWLWSWLTVGPLCFTDLLTACLVVFQEENRSRCRLHQKITSSKLSLSPSFSLFLCVIWWPSSMVTPHCPGLGPCDWDYSLISLLNLDYVTYWETGENKSQENSVSFLLPLNVFY